MNKRTILIIMFVAAVIGIAFALYFFFFRGIIKNIIPAQPKTVALPGELPESGAATPPKAIAQPPSQQLPSGGAIEKPAFTTPTIAQGGLTASETVVFDPVQSLVPAAKGNGVSYYNETDGKFYTLDDNGNKTALSDKQFFNVESIAWSPKQDRAVIEYPDGFNVIYDFENERQITLPQHWEQFQFSQTGNQISALSLGINKAQNWLLTANGDGTNARAIEPLGDNADKVIPSFSPDSQIVAFSKTGDPVGGEANEIYLIGQNNENFKSLIVDGYGFQPKWSKDGSALMYSTHSSYNDYKPLIWIVDAKGSDVGANRRELGISTWAHKCTFDSANSIICAVPNELQRGAGFAPEIADSSEDTFYKVDIQTGLKTPLATPTEFVNATDLSVSGDGAYLYYTNRLNNNEIERMRLK